MQQKAARRPVCGTALKRAACASMLLDHIGASCLEQGALAEGSAALIHITSLLRHIGRAAFPIYCFLLVEGFLHTGSARRYALRLLSFALISEIPFDWAFYSSPVYAAHQNVYWTLLLGLAAMWLLRRFALPDGSASWRGIACALGCAAAAGLLRTDYGAAGVLLIAALYLARAERAEQCAVGATLAFFIQSSVSYSVCAAAAFIPVWFYSGRRGRCGRAEKWAYYIFYPAHLGLLGAVTNLVILA